MPVPHLTTERRSRTTPGTSATATRSTARPERDHQPHLHLAGHLQRHPDRDQQRRGQRLRSPNRSRSTTRRRRSPLLRWSLPVIKRPSTRPPRPIPSARSPTTAGTSATAASPTTRARTQTDDPRVRRPRHVHRDPHDHQQPRTAGDCEPRRHGRHAPPLRSPRRPGSRPARRRSASTGARSTAVAAGTIQRLQLGLRRRHRPRSTRSTSAIASHSYSAPGMYTVRLTVNDDLGLTDTTTQTVIGRPSDCRVRGAGHADSGRIREFRREQLDRSRRLDHQLQLGLRRRDPARRHRHDGLRTHTFTHRGTYPVTLTVTNDSNQTDQITHDVTVDNPPTAFVTPSAIVATPGTSLSFDGTARSPGTAGPSATTSGTSATAARLTTPASRRPTATCTRTPALYGHADRQGRPRHHQHCDADRHDRSADRRVYRAADGRFAELTGGLRRERLERPRGQHHRLQLGLRRRQRHDRHWRQRDHDAFLQRARLYHVTLTVTNNSGQTDQITHDVTIDTAPTAAFSTPAGAQAPGSPVSFDASASTSAPAKRSIASYSWAFGDGAAGSGVSTSHSYAIPGHLHGVADRHR